MGKNDLPRELVVAIQTIYQPAGLQVTSLPTRELESEGYQACRLALNGLNSVFRIAKTTPTKLGQFVTTWKRPDKEIVPLDSSDGIDFLIVAVSDGTKQASLSLTKKF